MHNSRLLPSRGLGAFLWSLPWGEHPNVRLGGWVSRGPMGPYVEPSLGLLDLGPWAHSQQAQSLGRHMVTIPSLRAPRGGQGRHVGTIPRAPKRRPNYVVSFDPF